MTVPPADDERGDGDQVVEWRQFEVGQWLRLNLSPECPLWTPEKHRMNGRTGKLIRICRTTGEHTDPWIPGWVQENTTDHDAPRHAYEVWLGDFGPTQWCAAAELEPLEPAGPPPPGDDGSEG